MRLLEAGKFATFDGEQIGFAAQVGRVVQLEDIRLVSLSAKVGAAFRPDLKRPTTLSVDADVTWSLEENDSVLVVVVAFTVRDGDAALPEAVSLTVGGEYSISYRLGIAPPPTEVREQFLGAFAAINTIYNAWPYIREIVQNTSSRTGGQAVLLPAFRITPTPRPVETPISEPVAPTVLRERPRPRKRPP